MAFYSYGHPAPFSHEPYPGPLGASPPGQMDTSGYLPPYLLGSPAPKSPSRLRATNMSTGLTPGFHGLRTSGTPGGGTALLDRSHLSVGGGVKVDTKAPGGPPVQGLYNQAPSPARTSTPLGLVAGHGSPRRQLNFSVMNTASRGSSAMGGVTPSTIGPRRYSTPGSVGGLNLSASGTKQRTPPSPAQMDPFYTQGENLTSEDDYHDHWVTVFGFPPAASSYILEQFSQYGTILKHVVTSNGNWIHILFQSRLQAKKALSKNGKVYGNGIMVGVQPCIDKSVIEGYTPSPITEAAGPGIHPTLSTPPRRPTSIRPLTAAYQASFSAHQVAPTNPNTPQKSTGFFAKALEYMFGW